VGVVFQEVTRSSHFHSPRNSLSRALSSAHTNTHRSTFTLTAQGTHTHTNTQTHKRRMSLFCLTVTWFFHVCAMRHSYLCYNNHVHAYFHLFHDRAHFKCRRRPPPQIQVSSAKDHTKKRAYFHTRHLPLGVDSLEDASVWMPASTPPSFWYLCTKTQIFERHANDR